MKQLLPNISYRYVFSAIHQWLQSIYNTTKSIRTSTTTTTTRTPSSTSAAVPELQRSSSAISATTSSTTYGVSVPTARTKFKAKFSNNTVSKWPSGYPEPAIWCDFKYKSNIAATVRIQCPTIFVPATSPSLPTTAATTAPVCKFRFPV